MGKTMIDHLSQVGGTILVRLREDESDEIPYGL